MENPFVDRLVEQLSLNSVEQQLLRAANIRDVDTLQAALWSFPSLGRIAGVRMPELSNYALQHSSAQIKAMAPRAGSGLGVKSVRFPCGAKSPPHAPFPVGSRLPSSGAKPPGSSRGGGAGGSGGAGGTGNWKSKPVNMWKRDWPIRDQGSRGTCVAFSVAACREYDAFEAGDGTPNNLDLSEQYLLWAIKAQITDPWPNEDGTLLEYGGQALDQIGICQRNHWPYDGKQNASLTHATTTDPSPAAHQDAATWRKPTAAYNSTALGNRDHEVWKLLHNRQRPVAVTLPVFGDPSDASVADNWSWFTGVQEGRVFDPFDTSVVVGGHAVCIVGYQPDPTALGLGVFILRNSWGTLAWSTSPPPTGPAPAPGYGYVSTEYINKYLWEMYAV